MTEAEWIGCSRPRGRGDVLDIVKWLREERNRPRKALLTLCALCRITWDRVAFAGNHRALEASEDYADGRISQTELESYWRATRFEPVIYCEWACAAAGPAEGLANWRMKDEQDEAALGVFHATYTNEVRSSWWSQELRYAMDVLEFIFQEGPIPAEWRTDTAVSLARQMYESREFGAMPILADALQDAGCDNPDILDHCRNPGEHVRGCWVCDLVLGKS
jgi:hypothetical protein